MIYNKDIGKYFYVGLGWFEVFYFGLINNTIYNNLYPTFTLHIKWYQYKTNAGPCIFSHRPFLPQQLYPLPLFPTPHLSLSCQSLLLQRLLGYSNRVN